MHCLKSLRIRNALSPKRGGLGLFYFSVGQKLDFECNARYDVMSVQLFTAFQSEPLSPVTHAKQKKFN